MAEIVQFEDALKTYERDKQVFALALSGASARKIADHLGCTLPEVNASVIRMLDGVPPDLRARTTMLELARLDELMRGFYLLALPGPDRKPDAKAAEIVIKCMERRDRLLGLDAPQYEGAPLEPQRVKNSSTERIASALDRIAGKKVIDGEVVKRPIDEENRPTDDELTTSSSSNSPSAPDDAA